jgi:glycosyltransferase involved in cell wall biosynthesis
VINFITNLPRALRSGGFSGMNAAAHGAIAKLGAVNYVGPINPPASLPQRALSKAARLAGRPGTFSFFSTRRLATIAAEVERARDPGAQLDFFHGFTPWVLTRPARTYAAWSDCTFRDYVEIYHRRAQFLEEDLRRIEQAEAAWLRGAERVLFTSDWARGRAVADYGLDPDRTTCVGIFGESDVPDQPTYAGEKTFVFVSTNFEAKGGRAVLAALRKVRAQDPEARLIVVGNAPRSIEAEPGVTFAGYLRKEVPDEAARFNSILGGARALVHPTLSDIAPLLLVEAGYFGCPAISTRRFAIPELVEDGRTGLLLDEPTDVEAVAAAMLRLLVDGEAYDRMRRTVWTSARARFSKQAFERRLVDCVRSALAEGSVRT